MIQPVVFQQPLHHTERIIEHDRRPSADQPPDRQTEPTIQVVQIPAALPTPVSVPVPMERPPAQQTDERVPAPPPWPSGTWAPPSTERAPIQADGGHERTPVVQAEPPAIKNSVPAPVAEQPNNSDTLPESIRQTRPETIQKNSPNNSPAELIPNSLEPTEEAPQAAPTLIAAYKKKGKVIGRKRKYEEVGINGERPIKELIVYRHHTGKHWPGLSDDMERRYERYYFTKPRKGARDYDTHKGCWDRAQKWIADDAVTATGTGRPDATMDASTPAVVPFRKRAAGERV